MTKKTKRRITRFIAFILTLIIFSVPLCTVFADNAVIPPRVSGISDNKTYMLKNKQTGLYLNIPNYTKTTKNIHQTEVYPNSQYSRAVKITYSENNGLYTISAVLYENFGGGRVTFDDTTDNVYLTQEQSEGYAEWRFIYNPEYNAYRILNQEEKALKAVFTSDIVVSDDNALTYQLWTIEEVTVNPHLIKETYDANNWRTIEKKNIGRNQEWLFALPSYDMTTSTITDIEVVVNSSLVEIAHNGNYFITKINVNDTTGVDFYDNFALIKVTLDYNKVRYVMVQDSGTGNSDACITLPMTRYPRLNTVTITEAKQFMITLHSELGGVRIKDWIIDNNDVAEMATYNGYSLNGQSYAVIKAKSVGYTWITAVVDDGNDDPYDDIAYTKPIEVIEQYTDIDGHIVTVTDPRIINISTSSGTEHLEYNTEYLLKANSVVFTSSGKPLNEIWYFTNGTAATATMYGINFVLIQTERKEVAKTNNLVTNSRYYEEYLIAPLVGGEVEITLRFDKNRRLYLPDGEYCIQNAEYTDKFLRISDDINVKASTYTENNKQHWQLTYLNNGYYKITSSYPSFSSENQEYYYKSLMISSTNEDAYIQVGTYNDEEDKSIIPINFQWQITYSENFGYIFINKAMINDSNTIHYAMSIASDDGNNVLNMVPRTNNSDEWSIHTIELSGPYYLNVDNHDADDDGDMDVMIGYRKNAITVSLNIVQGLENDATLLDSDYYNAMMYAVTAWENALDIEINIVNSEDVSNIDIFITTKDYFDKPVDDDWGGATFSELEYTGFYKYCTGVPIYVYSIVESDIGIFVHNDFQIMKYIMLHELGHALGYIGHSPNSDNIMYKEINDNNNDCKLEFGDTYSLSQMYDEYYVGE